MAKQTIQDDELELLQSAKAGDVQARNELYCRYHPLAVKVFGRDDVSEAFLTFEGIIRRFELERYTRKTSFFVFLRTNWKYYQMNLYNNENEVLPVDPMDASELRGGSQPLDLNRESEMHQAFTRARELKSQTLKTHLSARNRQFLNLFLEGFTFKEIKAAMGIKGRNHIPIIRKIRMTISLN